MNTRVSDFLAVGGRATLIDCEGLFPSVLNQEFLPYIATWLMLYGKLV